ncbi:D-alanyl-D-alanine carboxypeptidase [Streptomyces sp. Rer75]|uniref:D-alanyl-D-alanine carboxypeptidase n=1 Tax=Streptomyces sp. Rer75 TaxID=2750011 RepID=UPI0015CFC866|nr:D-alanyl-D-alanine carboxypeptidase [Streptomyces sp. Rer75]QLH23596.1 D-alanyl-D-alanine carboxypeptidase [Streptomyces sp. Rer75]
MAGESPGKSDQQKSSGETARGARDPRLTAFREGEADGGHAAVAVAEDASESAPDESTEASAESGESGAASAEAESESLEAADDGDTSDVRESEDSESVEAESAEPESAETESGLPVRPKDEAPSPGATSGGAGETEKPEGSDARLREAVAAWVASDEPDADAEAEGEDAERAASGGNDDAGAKGDAASDDSSSDGPVDRKTAVFRTADVAADGDGDEDRTKAASDAESGAKGDSAASGGKDDAGADASRTEKAAADVDGEDDDSAAKDEVLGEDADSGAKGESDDDAASDDASSDGPVDRKTAAFRTPKTDPDADRDDDGPSGGKSDSGASADDKRPSGGEGDSGTSKDGSGETGDGKRASGGRRPAWAGSDDDEDEGGEKAASGDGDDKPSRPSVDQKTAVFRAPKVDEDGEPVDRPTAAFGVLPEKKGVDQPTTAIKALPSDADKGAKDDKGAKRSEGENERTSKFVPLRSPDDPAPAPAPAPEKAKAPAKPDTAPAKPGELPETERTKQQPLPPQTPDGKQPAPLDLLAELTNRPPKPETPIRTAVRRVKIWTPLVLLLVVLVAIAQAVRPLPDPELKLTADESYAFKGEKLAMPWSGEGQSAAEVEGVGSLGTSGAQKPVPIASVTKVMTAYVVLKDHPLKAGAEGPRIKIDATAAEESGSADESRASVEEGQSFTQHQLLQLLLINSSNNIARLLARWDAGSLDAFTKKMNDAAKSLGMKNTTYTDPSGLKESTKSTAADQLKLAKAAMQSEAFREVVATPNTQIPGLDGKIYNNNNLLVKPGVIGIKTGSSTPAGGALMWGAVRTIDGKKQRILGVVLEQRAPTTLDASLQLAQTESYKLITTVQDALTSATVIKKGDVVGQVDDGLGGTTPVVATKDLKAVGWAGLNVDIKIGDGGKTIPHTAKAGTVVGEVTVGSGPGRVKAPVALQNDLSEPSFGAKLTRIS